MYDFNRNRIQSFNPLK